MARPPQHLSYMSGFESLSETNLVANVDTTGQPRLYFGGWVEVCASRDPHTRTEFAILGRNHRTRALS